jgi:ubiquinone/menaquinone biosynthesis C-methylase UbiE
MGHVLALSPGTSEIFARAGSREQYPSSSVNIKKRIESFWQQSPCDSWFASGTPGTPAFYRSLDEHRYRVHPKLLPAVGFEKTRGLRVLEIGCGCGSEAERFARAGAHYTAVDLTNAALALTQKRLRLAGFSGSFMQGDAENLPFADDSFDFVYSHGVLHHTPDTARAIREVYRVLSPCGRAVVMLYHRDSFNYEINLRVIRRLRAQLLRSKIGSKIGIKLVQKIWHERTEDLERHVELINQDPSEYLDMQNMLNRNTDGPDNPLSQVFSKESATRLFWQFRTVSTEVMFWNPNWLPLMGKLLPRAVEDKLAARWGWHLWIFAQKPLMEMEASMPATAEKVAALWDTRCTSSVAPQAAT